MLYVLIILLIYFILTNCFLYVYFSTRAIKKIYINILFLVYISYSHISRTMNEPSKLILKDPYYIPNLNMLQMLLSHTLDCGICSQLLSRHYVIFVLFVVRRGTRCRPKFLSVLERFSNNLFSRKYLRDFSALVSERLLALREDSQRSNKIDYKKYPLFIIDYFVKVSLLV